ncbi:MAG: carotenoid biosynthesis protein [Ramlibacter sp.]
MTEAPTPFLLTAALVAACVLLFAAALWSAWLLAGPRSALGFAGLALTLGWFAEQMGSSRGWFFGRYHYTHVLGPEIGNVPVAIALMWFALCWLGYALASMILWRQPVLARPAGWGPRLLTAWLAAMIVTAFDLGADPYFVFVLKAWIMDKTDGGWFGETLQGFAGWMLVSFTIITLFQALQAPREPARNGPRERLAALVPLGIYASGLLFQLLLGHPVETRAVAFFAMGMPLLIAAAAWWHWARPASGATA